MKIAELKEMLNIELLVENGNYNTLNEIKRILEIAELDIYPSVLGRAIREKAYESGYEIQDFVSYGHTRIKVIKTMLVVDCVKERNFLYIVNEDEEKIPYYDFNEKEYLFSDTVRFAFDLKKSKELMNCMLQRWLKCEWIYSYLDKDIDLQFADYPTTIEKGCIKTLERLEMDFNASNIRAINYAIKHKINITRNYFRLYERLRDDIIYADKVIKLRMNDAKAVANAYANAIIIHLIRDAELLNFAIDYNRTTEYNLKLFEEYKKTREAEIFNLRLQEINNVNGKTLANGKYTIVVPQNVEDLQDEGRMQNNCVGYWYNNYILNGEYHILFVRKTESTDKSYITCRLDSRSHRVLEFRYKNNADAFYREENLIAEIQNLFD